MCFVDTSAQAYCSVFTHGFWRGAAISTITVSPVSAAAAAGSVLPAVAVAFLEAGTPALCERRFQNSKKRTLASRGLLAKP